MLKRILLVSCVGILLSSQNVQAGDAAQNGAWGGAVGGALLGQAIGRNTEGTLLGAAIGGVLGYAVGNEKEKDETRTVYGYQPSRVVSRYEERECRETEVVARVDGRPELVYGTVCNEDGEWVLQGDRQVARQTVIIDRRPYYPPPVVYYQYRERPRWHNGRHHQAFNRWQHRDRDGMRIIIR